MEAYHEAALRQFIQILDTSVSGRGICYYGGDQAWLATFNGRAGGCGTVAAANLLVYFGVLFPVGRVPLPMGRSLSLEAYKSHLEVVYETIKPLRPVWRQAEQMGRHSLDRPIQPETMRLKKGFWHRLPDSLGIPSVRRFSAGVCGLARRQGVNLKTVWPVAGRGYVPASLMMALEEAEAFIKGRLEQGYPVAMLNYANRGLTQVSYQSPVNGKVYTTDRFQWHWVVITGLEPKGAMDPRHTITVSSWGSAVELDLKGFWGKGLTYLVSFETEYKNESL